MSAPELPIQRVKGAFLWLLLPALLMAALMMIAMVFAAWQGGIAWRLAASMLGGGAALAIAYVFFQESPFMKSLKMRANELQLFCRAIKHAASTLELQDILDTSTEIIMRVTGVAGCTINLLNAKTGKMELRSSVGVERNVDISGEPYQKALVDGKPLVIRDTRTRDFPEVSDERQSLMCVPLRLEERILGAVCIYGEPGQRLSPEMISILASLGDVVSLAIAHALVYADFRELADAKTHFMLQASHELRSPSNAIQSIAQTLLRGYVGDLAERQKELVARIDTRARILSDVVSDLLILAKSRAETATRRYEAVDLCGIAREMVQLFEARASEKGVRLAILLDGPRFVHANEEGVRSVVTNLLANAIKYTPSGGEVRVQVSASGNRVVLEVSDTGIGIPKEEQGHLFTEFFRASNARYASEAGTGLGLAIVKDTVARCGGSIELESEEGKGSTFRVVLNSRSPAPV